MEFHISSSSSSSSGHFSKVWPPPTHIILSISTAPCVRYQTKSNRNKVAIDTDHCLALNCGPLPSSCTSRKSWVLPTLHIFNARTVTPSITEEEAEKEGRRSINGHNLTLRRSINAAICSLNPRKFTPFEVHYLSSPSHPTSSPYHGQPSKIPTSLVVKCRCQPTGSRTLDQSTLCHRPRLFFVCATQ